jgi:hypothetical protein
MEVGLRYTILTHNKHRGGKMIYKVIHNGQEASCNAKNSRSASEQLQWLMENKKCFCRNCRQEYTKEFGITLSGDNYNETCMANVDIRLV